MNAKANSEMEKKVNKNYKQINSGKDVLEKLLESERILEIK